MVLAGYHCANKHTSQFAALSGDLFLQLLKYLFETLFENNNILAEVIFGFVGMARCDK